MKKIYDNLIYYTICENLYNNINKTNYTSFINMCNNLHYLTVASKPLSTELYDLLTLTLDNINLFYGLNDVDTINYINIFIKNKLWGKHYKCVRMLKLHVNNPCT
jgi:hypothetical protein